VPMIAVLFSKVSTVTIMDHTPKSTALSAVTALYTADGRPAGPRAGI
jgi:hypothetical protein